MRLMLWLEPPPRPKQLRDNATVESTQYLLERCVYPAVGVHSIRIISFCMLDLLCGVRYEMNSGAQAGQVPTR
jgi:hypothetical protein